MRHGELPPGHLQSGFNSSRHPRSTGVLYPVVSSMRYIRSLRQVLHTPLRHPADGRPPVRQRPAYVSRRGRFQAPSRHEPACAAGRALHGAVEVPFGEPPLDSAAVHLRPLATETDTQSLTEGSPAPMRAILAVAQGQGRSSACVLVAPTASRPYCDHPHRNGPARYTRTDELTPRTHNSLQSVADPLAAPLPSVHRRRHQQSLAAPPPCPSYHAPSAREVRTRPGPPPGLIRTNGVLLDGYPRHAGYITLIVTATPLPEIDSLEATDV